MTAINKTEAVALNTLLILVLTPGLKMICHNTIFLFMFFNCLTGIIILYIHNEVNNSKDSSHNFHKQKPIQTFKYQRLYRLRVS